MPRLFIEAGYPIRRSPAKLARQLTEAYRSRATSFIGPQRLGIHRAPLVALTTIPLPPQLCVVGIPQVTLYSFIKVQTIRETPHSQKIGLMQADWRGCISEAESGVAELHCYRSVFPPFVRVKRYGGAQLLVIEMRFSDR